MALPVGDLSADSAITREVGRILCSLLVATGDGRLFQQLSIVDGSACAFDRSAGQKHSLLAGNESEIATYLRPCRPVRPHSGAHCARGRRADDCCRSLSQVLTSRWTALSPADSRNVSANAPQRRVHRSRDQKSRSTNYQPPVIEWWSSLSRCSKPKRQIINSSERPF